MSRITDEKRKAIQEGILKNRPGFENMEPVTGDMPLNTESDEELLEQALNHAPVKPSMEFEKQPQPRRAAPQQDDVDYDTPRRATPRMNPEQRTKAAQHKTNGSVLDSLRQKFGLTNVATYKLDVDGTVFQLQAINKQRLNYAAGLADAITIYDEEFKRAFDTALAACYVTHINGQPLWLAMGIEPTKGVPIADPDNPPMAISKIAYAKFFDFLHLESYDELSSVIVRAYDEHIEPHARTLQRIIRTENDDRVPYVCLEPGCTYEVLERPGDYYCKHHGTKLEAKPGANLPLA